MSLRHGVRRPVRRRTVLAALVLVFTSWATSLPAAQDAQRFGVPASIAGDCSRDVTDALNRWIASLPDGTPSRHTVLEFGQGACYRVDGTLGTAYGTQSPAGLRRRYLDLEGNGSTISGRYALPPPRTNRAGVSFVWSQGIAIRGFVVEGNHPNPCNLDWRGSCRDGGYDANREWQHGISLFATSDVVVSSNRILQVYGDGIILGQGDTGKGSYVQRALVEDNVIDGTGRMGVGVTAGVDVTIVRNSFDRVSYHAIDLENEASQPVQNIVIAGNKVGRKYLGFVAASSAECVPNNQGHVSIVDNDETTSGVTTWPSIYVEAYTLGGCTFPMIWSGFEIAHNTLRHIDTSGAPGDNQTIKLGNLVDVRITDNRIIQGDRTGSAIKIRGTGSGFTITGNDIREAHTVYTLNGVDDSPGIRVCGNWTAAGKDQPKRCTASDLRPGNRSRGRGPAAPWGFGVCVQRL